MVGPPEQYLSVRQGRLWLFGWLLGWSVFVCLFACFSVGLLVWLLVCLAVFPSLFLLVFCLSVLLSVCLSVCLSVRRSVCLWLFVRLSGFLLVCLFVYLPFIGLSCLALFCLVLFCLVLSVLYCPVLSWFVLLCPVLSCPFLSCRVLSSRGPPCFGFLCPPLVWGGLAWLGLRGLGGLMRPPPRLGRRGLVTWERWARGLLLHSRDLVLGRAFVSVFLARGILRRWLDMVDRLSSLALVLELRSLILALLFRHNRLLRYSPLAQRFLGKLRLLPPAPPV